MENSEYERVKSYDDENSNESSWIPFLRQTFVCSAVWCGYFILGLGIGATTVLVPQIRKEANSTEAVSIEMVSWLTAVYGFAGVPWVPILPIISYYFGLRVPFGLISIITFSGAILFYCSTSVTQILISEIFMSIVAAGLITVYLSVISEYSSPEYRGVFLALKSASSTWGILVSNTIGTFFHWKNIGILLIVCCSYISVAVFFWPESPYWLARKKRFEECKKSFYWLNGSSEKAKKELQVIIQAETNKYVENDNLIPAKVSHKIITSKNIYMPLFLCVILITAYYTCGKTVSMVYALDIIKKITNSESLAYTAMLILDGISVLGMYAGCAISRVVKRKKMYIITTSLGVLFISLITIYLYLIRFSVIAENKYVTLILLTLYSICICCGPLLLSTTICGELLPLQYRNCFVCFLGMYDRTIMGFVLKISPFMFHKFGTHGGFLVFTVISAIMLGLLIKYLPETKDKTLHEIQTLLTE